MSIETQIAPPSFESSTDSACVPSPQQFTEVVMPPYYTIYSTVVTSDFVECPSEGDVYTYTSSVNDQQDIETDDKFELAKAKMEVMLLATPFVLTACNVLASTNQDQFATAMVGVLGSIVPIVLFDTTKDLRNSDLSIGERLSCLIGNLAIVGGFAISGYAFGETSTKALVSISVVTRIGVALNSAAEKIGSIFKKK